MKRFLVTDTSTPVGGVALVEHHEEDLSTNCLGRLLSFKEWKTPQAHSENIIHTTQLLLAENHLFPQDLDVLGCGVGPGSFTGIRVGLNLMRTLAYSLDLPLVTFSSLQALAWSTGIQKWPVLCLVNAFKNKIYCAQYSWSASPDGRLNEDLAPQVLSYHQVKEVVREKVLVVGNGFDLCKDYLGPSEWSLMIRDQKQPDVPLVSEFCVRVPIPWDKSEKTHWKRALPLYIRASEAEEKLGSGLLRAIPQM